MRNADKVIRCVLSGLKWSLLFLVFSYILYNAVTLLKGYEAYSWPTTTTMVFTVVFFGSAAWREWTGWEKARRRTVAERSLGMHLLKTMGAYCICVAAAMVVGCLFAKSPSILNDSVLWIVVVLGLLVTLICSWFDWGKVKREADAANHAL